MPKEKISPGMKQYLDIKANYPDAFLLFRMGDFYELFYEDAVRAAQILELSLTSRNKNSETPIPMAGVPYHSVAQYIDTLIEKGHKVAIAEQMENPSEAKGIVKREVVQVITPGTYMENAEKRENNYLVALTFFGEERSSLAYADLSTGELKATDLSDEEHLLNELSALQTKEIVSEKPLEEALQKKILARQEVVFSLQTEKETHSEISFLVEHLTEPSLKDVAELLLNYLLATQKRSFGHLQQCQPYETSHFLKMDYYSKYNLEVTQTIRTGKKHGTLYWLLDETKTAMGTRLLKQWLDRPLLSKKRILERQEMTQKLLENFFERSDLVAALKGVYDLERLVARVSFGNANARDLLQLKASLAQVPVIKSLLNQINQGEFQAVLLFLDECPDLIELLEASIDEEAPMAITEGSVIKTSFHQQLDTYRLAMKEGSQWILELEAREREATGIRSLRIDYNRKDGYYIHITNANRANIPEGRYYRKATLKNAERYGTEELQKLESTILEATENSLQLEYELFTEIRTKVATFITPMQQTAQMIATIDVLQSFASVAEKFQYVRPTVVTSGKEIAMVNGRHPVVEKVLGTQEYVPNSIKMDDQTMIQLITGPNMSGKSTYMRQLALIVLMAQIGSFVPAERCTLPIFDKIFTRIGASDDLIGGQSTFMVEMMESNTALRGATPQSLILFDELGRGTATYDGMALAQAIIEYIHENVQAKTLFSTHYHELTDLEESLSHLKNVHVGAVEKNGEVIFLHKMVDGPADKSYGIHVAKIAGLPTNLLERAGSILEHLEQQAQAQTIHTPSKPEKNEQLSLFNETSVADLRVAEEIERLSLMEMTPIEALNKLYELKKMIDKSS